MWDGVFSPYVVKHRDHQHNSVAAHLAAQDTPIVGPVVRAHTNPITEVRFKTPEDMVKVDMKIHGKAYTFLIPLAMIIAAQSEKDKEKAIIAELDKYFDHKIEGGRNIDDYILEEVAETIVEYLEG